MAKRRLRPPEGIGPEHQRPKGGLRRHASPLSLLVFGAVVIVALTGMLGRERDWTASAQGVDLIVHAPEIIRNGEFLEMRFQVTSQERIDELVIGIEASLWEDLTVNTMIPAASEEESRQGEFRFVLGPMESDTEFLWKVDLQVNPDIVFGNTGTVTIYDGEAQLVSADLSLTVLP